MSIKGVVNPKTGELGYQIRVPLGKIDGKCRYKTKVIYGITVIQAQKQEALMMDAAKRCIMADSVADVYKAFLQHQRKNKADEKGHEQYRKIFEHQKNQ
jgi:hypothetical protein